MRNIKLFLSALLIILLQLPLQAQEDRELILSESRDFAKTLSAANFAGRGYQDNGHKKAAFYIGQKFAEWGLLKANGSDVDASYEQEFQFALNRIDSADLQLCGQALRPGFDFIANSRSGGHAVSGKVLDLGYGLPENMKNAESKVVVIREGLPKKITANKDKAAKYAKYRNDFAKIDLIAKNKAIAVIVLRKKLTYGLSPMPLDIPVLDVLDPAWPKKKKLRKEASVFIDREFTKQKSQNVLGWVRGSEVPDSFILVSAHYDHLGKQGSAIFYGGNDNASGTAMMMSMAKHYSKKANQPRYSMVFIGFGAEEAGLIGSRHYVMKNPLFPLEKTRFILNLDLMANGDKGITAVAGLDSLKKDTEEFQLLKALNENSKATPKVKGRTNAQNSDHYYFVKKGIPGMFIYTMGGPPHYHDVHDTYEEMQFSRYHEVRKLLMTFLETIME